MNEDISTKVYTAQASDSYRETLGDLDEETPSPEEAALAIAAATQPSKQGRPVKPDTEKPEDNDA